MFLLLLLSSLSGKAQLGMSGVEEGSNFFTNYSFEKAPHPDVTKVISIVNQVESKNNFIDWLIPDSTASLPFGLIKQIGNTRYVIAIDSMEFKKDAAHFSAYAALDFPGILNKIAFRGSKIKFNPSGVISGDQAKLYLVGEQYIKVNSLVTLHLFSKNQNWVEWNCGGFKAVNLSGEFLFRKAKLTPGEPEKNKLGIKGATEKDSVVRATFEIYTEDIHNFIAKVSITPFQVNGLKDWSFEVTNAIVDMSEISNSPAMSLPSNYRDTNIVSPEMWTGFYLQSAKVTLPPEFSRSGAKRILEVNNMLIDKSGLSGSFTGKDILAQDEGSMSGWNFSVSEIGIDFYRNRVCGGKLKGQVQIPITKEDQRLDYTASAFYNENSHELDFKFLVSPASLLRFDVFSASVELNKNSSISISKVNGYYKPSAMLHGNIGFDHSDFNTSGSSIKFRDLSLHTEAPFIRGGIFSLNVSGANPAKTGTYPVSLQEITFGLKDNSPVLGFNLLFNLVEDAEKCISAGTIVYIKGKIESKDENFPADQNRPAVSFKKTKWSLDGIKLGGISVDVQTLPCTIKGMFEHKLDYLNYGEGFFGNAEIRIVKVIQDPIAVKGGFGTKDDFRYFFLDYMVPSKYIMPGAPVGISHIIGGVSYHMKPDKLTEPEYVNLRKTFNSNNAFALQYTPDKKMKLGIKAGASSEFTISETLCNGDYFLKLDFNDTWGLSHIGLSGDVRAMAKSGDVDVPIKGKAAMDIDLDAKSFDFLAQVSASAYEVLSGTGYLKFHTEPSRWYICFGKPSAPMSVKVLNFISTPIYIMAGNDIEPALPAPASVQQYYGNSYPDRRTGDLANGKGFCMGTKVHSDFHRDIGFDFFRAHGDFDFDLGYDMMLMNYGKNAVCANTDTKVGIMGYQAEGRMYFVLHPVISISGHLTFPWGCPYEKEVCVLGVCEKIKVKCLSDKDFNFKVFESGVVSQAMAKFPKPFYFDGRISVPYGIFGLVEGSFDFNYSYGSNCNPVTN